MPVFLCTACGTSFPPAAEPPPACPICQDERQFVPPSGQGWTTREALAKGHRNAWQALDQDLLAIETVPKFGIGQRTLLLRTPAGNILWDCLALLDPATETLVRGLGGLTAIAVSHPHYYTTMQDWSDAFGCPIHLHAADWQWVMRPHPSIRFWNGDTRPLAPGLTLVRAGGHFEGGTVLHWDARGGALLVGDILQVTPGADWVSFLWSYPNMLPLPPATIESITDRLRPFRYARMYGAFAGQDIASGAETIVARSAARYVALVSGG